MKFTVSYGTPTYQESKVCDTPAKAKNELKKRLATRASWAAAHNHELRDALAVTVQEVGSMPVQSLKVGEERTWKHRDEHTDMTFVFALRKDSV